jgi:hypothetical protein
VVVFIASVTGLPCGSSTAGPPHRPWAACTRPP